MIGISDSERRAAFGVWLRTGRVPWAGDADGVEVKFNPWHDAETGRFTFAGSGHRFGSGEARADRGHTERPRITAAKPHAPRADQSARHDRKRPAGEARPNPAAEFVGGVGEGLYGVARETVAGVQTALTTNPITTVRHVGRGIAGAIDTAIAAEAVPARVQVSRAADAVASASAREMGRAAGSVVGNVALAAAPGTALGKVAAMRRLRAATPRPTFEPPQIGWMKEKLKPGEPWKAYNDAATGSRPDQAPTLMRTMPDGSKRPVKFDGFEGDFVIDRKWAIRDAARARAQLLRQSQALTQNRLIGVWEVPDAVQRTKALKLFRKVKVNNIKIRIAKP